ncbi:hypothetical protein [Candidatus Methylacidithermus pantelleriae]|uniref:Uncharacterized protein n=1 Tax=Candidatus Methylacidithermus pantelleriae TaxID=2744239 RepID=A0A8J2BHS0_9BACT|nr:hypothetical protein [Candidatus Methylacidithermus pantelleriae]CAF0695839.1 hypothetical protein MPNT_20029 [Candidatus Methylacidithermus pantelleriae]
MFEANVAEEEYPYREGRCPWEVVNQVQALLKAGHTEIVDAELVQ